MTIAITLGVLVVATILTAMFKADTPNTSGLAFMFGVWQVIAALWMLGLLS